MEMDLNNTNHLWHQRALPSQIPAAPTAVAAAAAATVTAAKKKPATKRSWEENYQCLVLYKAEHGNLCVPHKYGKDRVLAKWVSHTRESYSSGQLSQDRIEALDAIGFVWNPHEKKWMDTYQRLVAFWKEFGHSKVPTTYKPDPALGKWVSRQREDFSGGYMAPARKKKLDALGFVYRISKTGGRQKRNRPDDDRWDTRYAELQEFYRIHGHSNVPRPDKGADKLSGWVGVQRCNYGRGLMPQERIDRLRAVDFIFNFNERKKQEEWNKMYELLRMCGKKENGEFAVSIVGDEASSLTRWIQRQREKYKLHKLEAGREHLLRKLNFKFPDRPPKVNEDDKSNNLKRTLAEIDSAQPEDLFGSEARRTWAHMKADTSMVNAVVDLAGEDKDLGNKVAESINVLSRFMSMPPEELATRMSTPMANRTTSGNLKPAPQIQRVNAFNTLMPLIVGLREKGESEMEDCVEFLNRMIKRSKAEGTRVEPPEDPDKYNQLLTMAVELNQSLDQSQRSKAVVESCVLYFKHILSGRGQVGKTAVSASSPKKSAAPQPQAKRQRTNAKAPRPNKDWDNEMAG